jgi:hypothetical protein
LVCLYVYRHFVKWLFVLYNDKPDSLLVDIYTWNPLIRIGKKKSKKIRQK